MKRVIVDADQLPYSCGFAAKGEPVSHALQLAKKALMRIQQETGVEKLELYIKGTGNFREEVAFTQGYKTNRTAAKPETYEDIREYLQSQWGATKVDGMEVDDWVSILLWEDYVANNRDRDLCNVILSSPDKDLKNTPGWHHFPRTGDVKWVTPHQAERHFYYQMLEGDNVDNIKGLPFCSMSDVHTFGLNKQANTKGCGKATAKKLMADPASQFDCEQFVWERYMQWGLESGITADEVREYFQEQGTLLWMTRELNSFNEPVLYSINEDKYEEAAERVYGEGSYTSHKDTTGGGEEDLFAEGAGGVRTGAAEGYDSEWESFCNGSDD